MHTFRLKIKLKITLVLTFDTILEILRMDAELKAAKNLKRALLDQPI